jgi:hypothetical protein
MAALRIEHFQCHKFSFTVRVHLVDTLGNEFTRVTTYTESGVEVQVFDRGGKLIGSASLPPFSCFLRDYCNDGKEEAMCKNPKTFKLDILDKTGLSVKAGLSPAPAANDRLFWDFESGFPQVSNATVGETSFPQNGVYRVAAVVVSPDSCVSVQSTFVGVEGRPVVRTAAAPSKTAPTAKKAPAGKKTADRPKTGGKKSAPKKRK